MASRDAAITQLVAQKAAFQAATGNPWPKWADAFATARTPQGLAKLVTGVTAAASGGTNPFAGTHVRNTVAVAEPPAPAPEPEPAPPPPARKPRRRTGKKDAD